MAYGISAPPTPGDGARALGGGITEAYLSLD